MPEALDAGRIVRQLVELRGPLAIGELNACTDLLDLIAGQYRQQPQAGPCSGCKGSGRVGRWVETRPGRVAAQWSECDRCAGCGQAATDAAMVADQLDQLSGDLRRYTNEPAPAGGGF